jgi:sterol desaturase/sphingolipid hydroxylase (fatty acid hydroxylase superfamily)
MVPYKELTVIDANTAHVIEHVAQSLGIFIPLLVIKFSYVNFAIVALIINARELMKHDNRCSWLIGNHHLLHHKYLLYNYGEYWIDNLFGTCFPKSSEYIYGKVYT